MTKLTFTNSVQANTTVLENEFIDKYMKMANGEYVKVYLLLLRHLNNPDGIPTISALADMLECTEKDVIRALNYWKKQGLIDYEAKQASAASQVTKITQEIPEVPTPEAPKADSALPEKAKKAPAKKETAAMDSSRSRKEFQELLFVAEQYLGKVLSVTEIDTITYFYETLQMSADLIEYLIEYCVENNHKSIHYIKKVALSWHEQNITTVAQAKSTSALYNKNCYLVLNAFGIKGRAPAASEIAYIKRWNEEYCFSPDLILEACNRTMDTIHKPDFKYTESILKRWHDKGVRSKKDIEALDEAHQKARVANEKRKAAGQNLATAASSSQTTKPTNKFNNFDSRSYDMNDLERRLLQQ